MLELELYGKGVWGWVLAHPGAVRRERIRSLARAALREAMTDWAKRNDYPNLQSIFQASAWDRYGLTPRGKKYQQWQKSVFSGRTIPYFSPKRRPTGGVHMQEQLRYEGSGFRVSMRNQPDVVVAVLTLPGARVLNAIQTLGSVYRREFLNWDGAGRFNAQWIRDRAVQLFRGALHDEVRRHTKARLVA